MGAPETEPAIGKSTVFEVLTKPMPVLLPAVETTMLFGLLLPLALLPPPLPPPVGVLGDEEEGDVD